LKRRDHRLQSPGWHVVLPCLLQTLQACGVFVDRAYVFLEDQKRGRSRLPHLHQKE
jgi:hypothetical protein